MKRMIEHDRYGVVIKRDGDPTRITYDTIERDYVCSGCGGRITKKFASPDYPRPGHEDHAGWYATCAVCPNSETICHEFEYRRTTQGPAFNGVVQALPERFKTLVLQQRS